MPVPADPQTVLRAPTGTGVGALRRLLAWLILLAACALVFAAWRSPHLVLELGQLIRACF